MSQVMKSILPGEVPEVRKLSAVKELYAIIRDEGKLVEGTVEGVRESQGEGVYFASAWTFWPPPLSSDIAAGLVWGFIM